MISPLSWEQEKIYFSYPSYFNDLCSALQRAQKSVIFEVYIFASDQDGQQIADILMELAKRQVKVQVLVDGLGSGHFLSVFYARFVEHSIEVKIFNPLRLLGALNKRDHRKVCIIDDIMVFSGGMNIGSLFKGWRDTAVCVQGIEAHKLTLAFNYTWQMAWPQQKSIALEANLKKAPHPLSPLFRFNTGLRMRLHESKALALKIKQAQKLIWITNAYFIPPRKFIKALSMASKRGVDVRLVLPEKSDLFFTTMASRSIYENLLKCGVKIYEYRPSILHAKTMLIDDWAIVGSSNFNHRSLIHDLELDIVLTSTKSIQILKDQYLIDQNNSKNFLISDWYQRPWYKKILGRFFMLFRYWI